MRRLHRLAALLCFFASATASVVYVDISMEDVEAESTGWVLVNKPAADSVVLSSWHATNFSCAAQFSDARPQFSDAHPPSQVHPLY